MLYYYHYFLLEMLLPQNPYTQSVGFCIKYHSQCYSQLFSMDVSSDLHVNDRKHDMQPSSTSINTHALTLRWSWTHTHTRVKKTAHGATEFDENHVWTATKMKRERRASGVREKEGEMWSQIPTQKSTQSNSIWLYAITNKHTHSRTHTY